MLWGYLESDEWNPGNLTIAWINLEKFTDLEKCRFPIKYIPSDNTELVLKGLKKQCNKVNIYTMPELFRTKPINGSLILEM